MDFLKSQFKSLNIPFKKAVLPGRTKFCGMEDCKVVAHGCRKIKNLICGMEGEIVMGRG